MMLVYILTPTLKSQRKFGKYCDCKVNGKGEGGERCSIRTFFLSALVKLSTHHFCPDGDGKRTEELSIMTQLKKKIQFFLIFSHPLSPSVLGDLFAEYLFSEP